jgi:hypothetical protein
MLKRHPASTVPFVLAVRLMAVLLVCRLHYHLTLIETPFGRWRSAVVLMCDRALNPAKQTDEVDKDVMIAASWSLMVHSFVILV